LAEQAGFHAAAAFPVKLTSRVHAGLLLDTALSGEQKEDAAMVHRSGEQLLDADHRHDGQRDARGSPAMLGGGDGRLPQQAGHE
jgi:hypothetical protein